MTKLTLYVPVEAEGLIQKAKEIFNREGKSLSNFVIDALRDYVRLHEPGNPQQRLDTVMELGRAYRAPKTFRCEQPDHWGAECSVKICPLVYREEDYEIKKESCEFRRVT